jgi:hypothetical protein
MARHSKDRTDAGIDCMQRRWMDYSRCVAKVGNAASERHDRCLDPKKHGAATVLSLDRVHGTIGRRRAATAMRSGQTAGGLQIDNSLLYTKVSLPARATL